MPIIKHRAALQCLVAVRGHPFDRTAFDAMFQAMEGISATMVDQPAAARLMNPEGMRGFDVLVLY
ncbi:MAG: ThuA domain-containing protein, partial [Novosphingobium meiothermophilum]